MLRWPVGEDDEYDEPASWEECQEYMERPRMRGESPTEYRSRLCVARLSRDIMSSVTAYARTLKWERDW